MESPKRIEDGLCRQLGGDPARLHSKYTTRLILRDRPGTSAGDQHQSICSRRARGSPDLVWRRPARELANEYFGLDQGGYHCELWYGDRTDCKPVQIPPSDGLGAPIFLREYRIGSI